MPDDRKYSRVYHDAVEDPRFAGIWSSDPSLALWVRLLVVADATWPSPAPVPRSAKPRPLAALVESGLVELVAGDNYRIRGLDAERTKRAEAGRIGGLASARSRANDPTVTVQPSLNDRSTDRSTIVEPNRVETSRAETSRDEGSAGARHPDGDGTQTGPERAPDAMRTHPERTADAPHTPRQIVHQWLTDHGASPPVGWVNTALNELVKIYGAEPIVALWDGAPKDVKTSKHFVQLAERLLAPGVHTGKSNGSRPTDAAKIEDLFSRGEREHQLKH